MESMDEKNGDASGDSKDQSKQQSHADGIGAAMVLAFPATPQDPTPLLAPLRDKHSNFAAVVKTCVQLNQYALNGSSSALDETQSGVAQSTLIHDPSMASALSGAFTSLTECLQTHNDRRAKILCCQTIAILARATFAKLRHSPQLFALRESANSRLEDEAGTDVPMALVGAALEDPDDGVAASALQALGNLCLSTGATTGTLVEDDLWREIASLVQQRPSPYAPTLADLEDEESYIPQVEMQTRILENVITPRLLQLVGRVVAFEQESHIAMILPVLTTSLEYLTKTSVTLYTMDRESYAKRWVEIDYVNLVNTVVQVLLLPAMQSTGRGHLAHAAAMSAIRLVHACPYAPWVTEVCEWVMLVLKEELDHSASTTRGTAASLETRMINLASLLICARAIPLPDRANVLLFCLDKIRSLPSTTMATHGVHSAGLLLQTYGLSHYRKPARVAFLSEIALSLFMDGPIDSSTSAPKNPRSSALENFLRSRELSAVMKEGKQGNVTQLREELVLAFCMVAVGVGRRHKDAPEYSSETSPKPSTTYSVAAPKDDFTEWARMSTMVLNTFQTCLGWESGAFASTSYMDENVSLLASAQSSYVRLAQELTHAVGLLPSNSVSLKMTPSATPPHILWDQLEESAAFLGKYDCNPLNNQGILEKIGKTMENCTKRELKGDGIINHHLRIYLLTLTADQWVQGRYISARKELEGKLSGSATLNANSAIDLLQALSPKRVFAKLVDEYKNQIEAYPKKKRDLYKKYSQDTVTISVACIENIAYATSDWRKRFGNSAEIKSILNAAIASLQGKGPNGESDQGNPVLPICEGAIERIQAAFTSSEQPSLEHVSLSPLLMNAGDLKSRPAVTATRSGQNEVSYHEGYMTQLSRLIIAARIDRCTLALPVIASFQGAARKQNWLRLALPPLPPCRDPQVPIASIPKFSWGTSISAPHGGSDAAAIALTYSMRRNLRYDGENEFRLTVTMRVHNITAVEVPEGILLHLGLQQESAATSLDAHDPTSLEIMKSLNENGDADFLNDSSLASAATLYKLELQSGDHLTWEVMMDPLPMTGALCLQPSVEYRAMEDEPSHAAWIGTEGKDADRDDTSAISAASQQSYRSDGESKGNEEKVNITVPGEPMKLSAMVGLQPCPLVFFRDGCGDILTFRYLWERMPHQITPLQVGPESGMPPTQASYDTLRLAALSTVKFKGNVIPGGEITRLWAFASLTGKRALFVLAESQGSGRKAPTEKTVHIRGDDKHLLCCLTGTLSARMALTAALLPGFKPL